MGNSQIHIKDNAGKGHPFVVYEVSVNKMVVNYNVDGFFLFAAQVRPENPSSLNEMQFLTRKETENCPCVPDPQTI